MLATSTPSPSDQETQIRECVDALTRALRSKDIGALMQYYAPEMVTFDLRPPAQIQGVDAYRKNFEAWFGSVEGLIDYQTRDLRITVNGDVAFCHSLNHVKSTRKGGEKADYWVRVTSGFEKIGGQWLITHEHVSMPIDMRTMQAEVGPQQ